MTPGTTRFAWRTSRTSPRKRKKARLGATGFGFNTHQYCGSLSLVSVPSKSELAAFTQTALANLRYPLLAQAKLPPRPSRAPVPVPERAGEPSVFQHVIYIIKENRSYDQVLGDVTEGNGDADLCIFGERVTPNQHKFVRDFALLDNTYCSGILSADGHNGPTAASPRIIWSANLPAGRAVIRPAATARAARRAGVFARRFHLEQRGWRTAKRWRTLANSPPMRNIGKIPRARGK